jgi:hypothetical protein
MYDPDRAREIQRRSLDELDERVTETIRKSPVATSRLVEIQQEARRLKAQEPADNRALIKRGRTIESLWEEVHRMKFGRS